jgi:pimeloyl-ACP methyl ester carboxylesterase
MPEVAGVVHRYVDTGRLRLHVAEAGSGPVVLLLHGWPQHWYAWRKLIPLLADSCRLVCPDLRGFGWSDAPAGGYATKDLAADVVALLDVLELDAVDVVAQAEGARVGFEVCLDQPGRIRRMVTLAAMHPYPRLALVAPLAWRVWWTPLVETTWVGRWVLRHLSVIVRGVLRASCATPGGLEDQALEEFVASIRERGPARASERLMHSFAYREMLPAIAGANRRRRLETPVLMLGGERDFFYPPRCLGGFEPYTEDLRVEVVAGAGHLLAEERPEAVAAAVRGFLARGATVAGR